jgi:hypothetical protein
LRTNFQNVSKKSRIKTVRETTETIEHKCTAACFRPERRRPKPKNLHKVDLGYVYVAPDGKCYSKRGFGNWMQVLGLTFAWTIEGFTLMWEPAEQLHIHSPGGRTIGKYVDEKEIRPDENYHFAQAAKKARQKGRKLVETERSYGAVAKRIIGVAPKRSRVPKGTGRGAPGMPRSPFSKEVVRLKNEGVPEGHAVEAMVKWSTDHGHLIAGPFKTSIKQRTRRWYRR